MNAIQSWARVSGLVFALTAGCSSFGEPLEVGVEPPTGGGRGSGGSTASTGGTAGTGGALGLDAGMTTALQVLFTADRTTVCPGQCALLSVSTRGGQADQTYAWSEGLGNDSGPHQVCPDATTTYRVSVSDSGGSGEFAQPVTIERELRIQVAKDCTNGDGGVPEPGDIRKAEVLCTNTWSSPSLQLPPQRIHLNDDGHTVLIGQLAGGIDFGDVQLQAGDGGWSSFVAEVDDKCQVVWATRFGDSASQVNLIGAVRDEDGSIYLTGYFSGIVDFGLGPVAALLGARTAGVLLKLAPDRTTQWVVPFGASAPLLVFGPQYNVGHALELYENGDVLFGYSAGQSTRLGGDYTIDPGSTVGPHGWLAKLTSTGEVLWQHDLGLGLISAIAAGPMGGAAAMGWGNNGTATTMLDPLGSSGSAFLDRFSDDGSPAPRVQLPYDRPGVNLWSENIAALAFDDRGHVMVASAAIDAAGDNQTTVFDPYVTTFNISGGVERVLPIGEGRGPDGSNQLPAIAADGDLVSAFTFAGPASVSGYQFDGVAESSTYSVVARWSADGQLEWLHQAPLGDGAEIYRRLASIDVNATMGVAMAQTSFEESVEDVSVQSITYTRLAP